MYKSNDVPDVRFHHSFVQVLVGILCLLWGTFIPFSRYLVGVHSVDQILQGSLLGLWEGLTLHFCVRDNLLNWMFSIIRHKNDSSEEEQQVKSFPNPKNKPMITDA